MRGSEPGHLAGVRMLQRMISEPTTSEVEQRRKKLKRWPVLNLNGLHGWFFRRRRLRH